MDDTISRLAVIQIIEKMRARIGHNLERAVGGAMIEILDEVGEDVGKLPSALGTNLAQLGTDCISRQAAIEAVQNRHMMLSKEKVLLINDLEKLPSAQPEIKQQAINSSDCIDRRAALDALRKMQTYKLFSGDDMLLIDQAGAMTELMLLSPAQLDTYWKEQCQSYEQTINKLRESLSTQPEIIRCCECKYLQCNMRPDGYLPKGVDEFECRHWCGSCDPMDFCSYAERREVTE